MVLDGIESPRIKFRLLEYSDFAEWLPFYKNLQTNKYWRGPKLTPDEECDNWFDNTFERYARGMGGMNVLIEKSSGNFLGQCGLLTQIVDGVEELEVAYSILPEYWNKGYATEAAKECIQYAFIHTLRDSVISIIHEDNIESEKVALKNGLKLSKRTIYKDNPVKIYRIMREDFVLS